MIRDPKPIGGGVCELTLSNGMVSLISEGDASTLGMYRWHMSKPKSSVTQYAKARVTHHRLSVLMHRVILCFPLMDVDHINRDGLDNRRENLRLCSRQQNACNRRLIEVKTSKYRGVYKDRNKWRAQVKQNGCLVSLGSFVDEVDAALRYDKFVKSLRGEFAVLNFPFEAAP